MSDKSGEHHDHTSPVFDYERLINLLGTENAARIRSFLWLRFSGQMPFSKKKELKDEYDQIKEIIRSLLKEVYAESLIEEVIKPVYKKLKIRFEA